MSTKSPLKRSRKLGVCSWSLKPGSSEDLVAKVKACGVKYVQLALNPYIGDAGALARTALLLRDAGFEIRSGMMQTRGEDYTSLASIAASGGVRPDEHWKANLAIARACAELARSADVCLVTFHAGFLPHERADPERAKLIERLRSVIDVFAEHDVRVGFETGQERAATLLDVLDELERPSAGINFDPANMILYGMGDPIEALAVLGPRVVQVHVKDAIPAVQPGAWGEETRTGLGLVKWKSFFALLDQLAPDVDAMIERESGQFRVEDIRAARLEIDRYLGPVVKR